MSAICGIINTNGAPVDPERLEKMALAAAHRGPDGIHYWIEGNVGVANLALHTTPEALHEHQPLVNQRGDLVLTTDARVDNREELIHILSTKDYLHEDTPTDADLILAAYECWGETCPEYLIGDFAFAIWDTRERKMFLARDHMGVRTLFYHFNPEIGFVFGTEIKMLLATGWVPRKLDEARLVQAIIPDGEWDKICTFYQDILNLPPAHFLRLKANQVIKTEYWRLDPSYEIHYASDEEYVEGFRERFFEAVRCRLRSNGGIGSFLSGGLDSSSIACTARQLLPQEEKLLTFSFIFDTVPESDEREYIQAILDQGEFEPHFIHGDQLSPFSNMQQEISQRDEPILAPNFFLHSAAFQEASRQGLRVLLDGYGGDSVIFHNIVRLKELAYQRHWITAFREAYLYSKNFNKSFRKVVFAHFIRPNLPHPCVQIAHWLKRYVHSQDLAYHQETRIREEILEKAMKKPEFRSSVFSSRQKQYDEITHWIVPVVFELTAHRSAISMVESRYPFGDKRLVEYCLGLPSEQKMSGGMTRSILRRGMDNLLPETVRLRTSKGNLSHNFHRQLLTRDTNTLEHCFGKDNRTLDAYLKTEIIRKDLCDSAITKMPQGILNLWMWSALCYWLENFQATL